MPFELAVRDAGALGIMTSYNRFNGVYCSEHDELLRRSSAASGASTGFVVTDWFGAASSVDSTARGPRPRDARARTCLRRTLSPTRCSAGDVDEADLDADR